MAVRVDRMTLGDVPEVMAIERESFTAPWPASAYRRELSENRMAHYFVLRLTPPPEVPNVLTAPVLPGRRNFLSTLLPRVLRHDEPASPQRVTLAGYAGLWLMVDEAHITTIAVHPKYRGQGIGELLLLKMIDTAEDVGARWLTLEVRKSNEVAQTLYRKYTFKEMGVRRRYYSDDGEDALIMWTDPIDSASFRDALDRNRTALMERRAARG